MTERLDKLMDIHRLALRYFKDNASGQPYNGQLFNVCLIGEGKIWIWLRNTDGERAVNSLRFWNQLVDRPEGFSMAVMPSDGKYLKSLDSAADLIEEALQGVPLSADCTEINPFVEIAEYLKFTERLRSQDTDGLRLEGCYSDSSWTSSVSCWWGIDPRDTMCLVSIDTDGPAA